MKIEKTKDYDKFKLWGSNRDVDLTRAEKIARSIKRHGFLVPISVNKHYQVIDGQHRLAAAKMTECEVYYIVCDVTERQMPEIVSEVNSVSKNWSIDDYINMWADFGKDSYLFLIEMKKMSLCLSFADIIKIYPQHYNKSYEEIKSGSLAIDDDTKKCLIDNIKYFNDAIGIIYSFIGEKRSKKYVRVLLDMIVNKNTDRSRLLDKLTEYGGLLMGGKTYAEASNILLNIYNHHLRNKIEL